MSKEKIILWDFEGTLARRLGGWSGALAQALIENEPGCAITVDDIRPFLQTGFPWQQPEIAHSHITTAEAWWTEIENVLARAYTGVGFSCPRAEELARFAHQEYIDVRKWVLYDDVLPVLQALLEEGWGHIILSNHIPELSLVVAELGLTPSITHVISSALIGYEKPHRQAFLCALEQSGHPKTVWMIGDNVKADILGGRSRGDTRDLAAPEG